MSATDLSNARRLVEKFGDVLRFWDGRWFAFQNGDWEQLPRDHELRYAQQLSTIIRDEAHEFFAQWHTVEKALALCRWADRSESLPRMQAALRLLAVDPRIAQAP